MNNIVEFKVYDYDLRNIGLIKRHFNFIDNDQAIVFALSFVADHVSIVKSAVKKDKNSRCFDKNDELVRANKILINKKLKSSFCVPVAKKKEPVSNDFASCSTKNRGTAEEPVIVSGGFD